MNVFLNDLEPLDNIIDNIIFEEEPTLFCDEYMDEFVETIFYIIDEFISNNPTLISEHDFHDILTEEIIILFETQFEEQILNSDYVEEDLNEILKTIIHMYTISFNMERSIQFNMDLELDIVLDMDNKKKNNSTNEIMEKKIQQLREIPQPAQRTKEWYEFRWGLITASSAWKIFGTQSVVNQIIYEKCKPLETIMNENNNEVKMVNVNTPLHWGQKYEPLSVLLYEHMYNSKVEDFGCIKHSKYNFLGASPDGIIIDSSTGRYGRMLEIKNIVNREINGNPKKEYWIQMQLQMEVCDLNECDFLETKFIEYPDAKSYQDDSIISSWDGANFNSYITTKDGGYKGIIIQFYKNDGNIHYEYMPVTLWKPQEVQCWEEDNINKYETEPYNYTFIKFIYWKLEKISCVLILRNKEWFENNIDKIANVWETIKKERITGYEHRAPNRQKRERSNSNNLNYFKHVAEETCLLKIIKKDA
jgi:putative phage-type endonuclease